jgi:hypothetical protein
MISNFDGVQFFVASNSVRLDDILPYLGTLYHESMHKVLSNPTIHALSSDTWKHIYIPTMPRAHARHVTPLLLKHMGEIKIYFRFCSYHS